MRIPTWVCHQLPERSLVIGNKTMPLCARCFSFYLSLILGFIIIVVMPNFINNFSVKQLIIVTLIMIAPLVIDGVTQFLNPRSSNNTLRVITGFTAGLICGIDVYSLLTYISLF